MSQDEYYCMKNFLLVTLILGVTVLNSFSQGMYMGYTSGKPVYIELNEVDKDYQLIDPVFQIEKVIDSTNSKGVIGVVQKGIANVKRPAKFKTSISHEFNKFINSRYYDNPYGKKLTMVVKQIRISEKSKAVNESGQVILSVRYYYQNELFHSDMLAETNKTVGDITNSHKKTLSSLLETSFKNLSDKIDNKKDS